MDITNEKVNLEIFKQLSEICEICFDEFDQNE